MAANPKLPPNERNLRDDHAHVVLTRKRTNPWPLILVIIAVIVLVALIVWVVLTRSLRSSSSLHIAPSIQQTIASPAIAFDEAF